MDVLKKLLLNVLEFLGLGGAPELIGVASKDDYSCLIYKDYSGKFFYYKSADGIDFDKSVKNYIKDFPEGFKFFKPCSIHDWNNTANAFVSSRQDSFDHARITILGEFDSEKGRLVIYDSSYKAMGHQKIVGGGFLLSNDGALKIKWRSNIPLWEKFLKGEEDKYFPLGAVRVGEYIFVYYQNTQSIYVLRIYMPFEKCHVEYSKVKINKYLNNPILTPLSHNHWESMSAFNPAAIYVNDKVHMFYRAQGYDHLSVVGYASSADGYNFERLSYPVYIPDDKFVKSMHGKPKKPKDYRLISGNGWGGCEDPRVTYFEEENLAYMVYIAFDGWSQPRLAMSSITIEDLESHNWDNWSDPVFLTPFTLQFGAGNKSGVLFPRKINDKYYVLHRVWPNICIDWVDDLDFGEGKKYLQTKAEIKVRPDYWDSSKIGAGAPPIETSEGWLLIYFGVGYQDSSKYKIGAMLLDINDPTKVIARSSAPLISPDEWYENEGKPGVTYPCGAIVKDGDLIIYYGGGDAVVCAAHANLEEFLIQLKADKVTPNTFKLD